MVRHARMTRARVGRDSIIPSYAANPLASSLTCPFPVGSYQNMAVRRLCSARTSNVIKRIQGRRDASQAMFSREAQRLDGGRRRGFHDREGGGATALARAGGLPSLGAGAGAEPSDRRGGRAGLRGVGLEYSPRCVTLRRSAPPALNAPAAPLAVAGTWTTERWGGRARLIGSSCPGILLAAVSF